MGSGEIGNHAVSLWLVRVDLEEAVQAENQGFVAMIGSSQRKPFVCIGIGLHLQYDIDFCQLS